MAKVEKDKDKDLPPIDARSLNDKIDTLLLESRRIFLFDAVDNQTSYDVIRKLWYLELSQPGKPITFIINSPGGSVDSGLAVWDQVKLVSSPIITCVCGLAASMGSVLSLCASPGKRYATPHSRIMVHQPSISGPVTGQATDLSIHAKEIIKTKEMLIELYMEHSGRTKKEIEKALDRDTWMSAQEALDFGLLDKIVDDIQDIK